MCAGIGACRTHESIASVRSGGKDSANVTYNVVSRKRITGHGAFIMAAPATRAYAAGHFEFNLDGSPTAAWIKSVEGGAVKSEVITEKLGPDDLAFRHTSTLAYEPFTINVAMAASKPFLQWIKDSWSRKFQRRTGSIVHADFNLEAHLEQKFLDALIAEVVFPTLDAGSKEPAYLGIKMQPEKLTLEKASGKIKGVESTGVKAKLWNPSLFRLNIEGVDCTKIRKIDSITVKQKITQLYFGTSRAPELEPTGIEFPNITLTMAASYANDFVKWHQQFVVDGAKDTEQVKSGFLEFLDPQGSNPIFTINMDGIGIHHLSIEKSEANSEELKQVRVELFVDYMELELGDSGLE